MEPQFIRSATSPVPLHRFSRSLLSNLKWGIRRVFRPPKADYLIREFIYANARENANTLNFGCGIWTPYDHAIKKRSASIVNIDATLIARLAHPINGRVILVDDEKLYKLLHNNSIDLIISFHTLVFTQIDLPRLIKHCKHRRIQFLFDIAPRTRTKTPTSCSDLSPYMRPPGLEFLKDTMMESKVKVYEVIDEISIQKITPSLIHQAGLYFAIVE